MPRLFVAIDLPETVKEQLFELEDISFIRANWIPPEKLHLTVRFIGEVGGGLFKDIKEALSYVNIESFPLQIKGVGHFPLKGEPKILWAGVEPNKELKHLNKQINRRLRELGVPAEQRKFHPHITLARLSRAPDEHVVHFLKKHSLLKSEPFQVEEFALYSSLLSSSGSTYHQETRYLLGAEEAETPRFSKTEIPEAFFDEPEDWKSLSFNVKFL